MPGQLIHGWKLEQQRLGRLTELFNLLKIRIFHGILIELALLIIFSYSWGLSKRDLDDITVIDVDEFQWHKGHNYLALIYQVNSDCTRLFWVGKKRTEATFANIFDFPGKDRTAELEFTCSDMWKPYLKVIKQKAGHVLHIPDRFHIVARPNRALDEVTAEIHRNIKNDGYESILTKSRYLLLKRPENLTLLQEENLSELLKYNLKRMRAYLLKEDFQQF